MRKLDAVEYNWIGTGAGRYGLGYNYVVRRHDAQAELYIDRGKDSAEENKRIFDQLAGHKEAIESSFGEPLEWQRLDNRRACRIRKVVTLGGYRDEEKWSRVQDEMIDAMVRLEKALGPHIAELAI